MSTSCHAPTAAPTERAASADKESPMEWKGQFCAQSQPSASVILTQRDWAALWAAIGQPPPQADLAGHAAVAVFLGQRNTGGYGVRFHEPVAEGKTAIVRYEILSPKGFVIQALTQPYAVRLFPKTGLPFKIVEEPAK